ncbi:MAG: hypothetical protein C5B49_16600 [Bdellovibrio sp.]|nr:MAG: hypothetical protein C5B49_16600 [Bdellovibrio sp.]
MAFLIEKKPEGARVVLVLKGDIDEEAELASPDIEPGADVVLDLTDVKTINSMGMRMWLKWVKTIPESVQLSVRRCPKMIVDQINMVAGFLPEDAKVESFFVPYYSEISSSEKLVLFEQGKEYKGGKLHVTPVVRDDSGNIMEMDVIDSYFRFIQKRRL